MRSRIVRRAPADALSEVWLRAGHEERPAGMELCAFFSQLTERFVDQLGVGEAERMLLHRDEVQALAAARVAPPRLPGDEEVEARAEAGLQDDEAPAPGPALRERRGHGLAAQDHRLERRDLLLRQEAERRRGDNDSCPAVGAQRQEPPDNVDTFVAVKVESTKKPKEETLAHQRLELRPERLCHLHEAEHVRRPLPRVLAVVQHHRQDDGKALGRTPIVTLGPEDAEAAEVYRRIATDRGERGRENDKQ